jgi:hypothetical protein
MRFIDLLPLPKQEHKLNRFYSESLQKKITKDSAHPKDLLFDFGYLGMR